MPNLVSFAASIAELTREEKSRDFAFSVNQAITHLTSLFDKPETEACASELVVRCCQYGRMISLAANYWVEYRPNIVLL